MRDEDVADRPERDVRCDQLPGDAIAAIDDVGRLVHENDLRGRKAGRPRPRTAGRAEKDQTRPTIRRHRAYTWPRCREDCSGTKKFATAHRHSLYVGPSFSSGKLYSSYVASNRSRLLLGRIRSARAGVLAGEHSSVGGRRRPGDDVWRLTYPHLRPPVPTHWPFRRTGTTHSPASFGQAFDTLAGGGQGWRRESPRIAPVTSQRSAD